MAEQMGPGWYWVRRYLFEGEGAYGRWEPAELPARDEGDVSPRYWRMVGDMPMVEGALSPSGEPLLLVGPRMNEPD